MEKRKQCVTTTKCSPNLCWSELWMAKTQLQNVIGKNHVSNSDVQLFLNFRCIGFCITGFELFSEPERVMFFIL